MLKPNKQGQFCSAFSCLTVSYLFFNILGEAIKKPGSRVP